MRPPALLGLLLCVVGVPWHASAAELSPAQRRTAYCAGVMKARVEFFRHTLSQQPNLRAAVQPGLESYGISYKALLNNLKEAGILDQPAVRDAGLRAAADMAYCATESSTCRDESCRSINSDPRCAAILDCDETGAG